MKLLNEWSDREPDPSPRPPILLYAIGAGLAILLVISIAQRLF